MKPAPIVEGHDSGGRYDAEAGAVRHSTEAALVGLIVLGGIRGSGFSVTCNDRALLHQLPELLRSTADQIEDQQKQGLMQ